MSTPPRYPSYLPCRKPNDRSAHGIDRSENAICQPSEDRRRGTTRPRLNLPPVQVRNLNGYAYVHGYAYAYWCIATLPGWHTG